MRGNQLIMTVTCNILYSGEPVWELCEYAFYAAANIHVHSFSHKSFVPSVLQLATICKKRQNSKKI